MEDTEGKPVIGRKSSSPEQRKWLLGGAAALAVLIVIVLVVLVVNSGSKENTSVDGARQAAQEATEKGDYAKAFNDLKALEGTTMSKEQQVQLYSDLAAAAANNNKVGEAIGYLERKHELDPETAKADALMLATLYEDVGDGAKALPQYQVALEYAKSQPESEASAGEISVIEDAIARLQGEAQ